MCYEPFHPFMSGRAVNTTLVGISISSTEIIYSNAHRKVSFHNGKLIYLPHKVLVIELFSITAKNEKSTKSIAKKCEFNLENMQSF